MLSNLKKFFKTSKFLLFLQNAEPEGKICEDDKTEFSLFMESHSHLTEGTKK